LLIGLQASWVIAQIKANSLGLGREKRPVYNRLAGCHPAPQPREI